MSQTTMLDHSKVDNMCIQTSPSSPREEYYLTLRGDDPASKQNNPATYTSQNGPWKTSFENTLTKTRNWMAHVLSWQTVKAFFEKTLTQTSNLLARILSQQNLRQSVDFYETTAHGMGTACRKAGRNIFERATSPSNTTNSTSSYLAMQSSASSRSTKSWIANTAKVAVFGAVTAVRVLCVTATMGLDAALAAVECAGAAALYGLDALCEEE